MQLEQDFEKMHPRSTMKLYAEWPILATFIEKKLTNKKDVEHINDALNLGIYETYIKFILLLILCNAFVLYKQDRK